MTNTSQDSPEHRDSWWRRAVGNARALFVSHEVTSRLRKAERAVEATYLDKPQAEANNLQAEGAASLIEALNATDDACIQLGTLLLIKATRAGRRVVIARTLTLEELRQLERNQTLLREPEKLLELLESIDRRQNTVVDASAHN